MMAKRAKAEAKAEARAREAAAKAEAKAEAKEAKEEKRAAEKRAKAEAKAAKAAQKGATRTTKAGAKARRAAEKGAKSEEQETLQDGRQAASAGTIAEVVQERAAGSKARRAQTDPGAEGNEQGTPARGNENENGGKAKAQVRRTATRGRLHKIGRLDSSRGGRATTEGAPGGGAPTGGR